MTPQSLAQRRALLTAALGFVQLEVDHPGVDALKTWLADWRGIGVITVGMARQGYDLQLTEYAAEHWRVTFFVTGNAHSIVGGSAWETSPWRAVQRAAWLALNKDEGGVKAR